MSEIWTLSARPRSSIAKNIFFWDQAKVDEERESSYGRDGCSAERDNGGFEDDGLLLTMFRGFEETKKKPSDSLSPTPAKDRKSRNCEKRKGSKLEF